MLGTRWRKIRRDIGNRKTRSLMVSFSIFIGVLGVVTLTTVGDVLTNRLERDLNTNEMPFISLWMEPDENSGSAAVDTTVARHDDTTDAVLNEIRAYPGVTHAQAVAYDRLYWRAMDDTGFVEAWLRSYSEPLDALELEPMQLVEGTYPVSGQQQIAVDQRMAQEFDLSVGDPVVVRVISQLTGDPAQGAPIPEETWTISAIVYQPYDLGDGANRRTYLTFDDFQYLTGQTFFQEFEVRFTSYGEAREAFDDFPDYIGDSTPYTLLGQSLNDPTTNQAIQETREWSNALLVLAIMAMIVATLLVVTVIITIVIEQRKQIGTMKSLGASRFDNLLMYTGLALMYGAIGSIPGVLVGIPAGAYLSQKIAWLTNILITDFAISTHAIVLGLALGLGMPVLAAILPVFLGTRVTIREATTDRGISSHFGYGLVTRGLGLLPIPITARQALANVYQRKGRLFLTGLTLTLAVGAFMGVTGLFISIDDTLDRVFATFDFELAAWPIRPENYDYDEVGALIAEQVDDIDGIYPASNTGVDFIWSASGNPNDTRRYWVFVNGIDPSNNSIAFDLDAGTGWQDNPDRPGIVITRSLAEELGLEVGDWVRIERDDYARRIEVIGIDRWPFERAFMRWQDVAAIKNSTTPDVYLLSFKGDLTGAEVDRRAGEIRDMLLQHGIVAGFENQRAEEEENAQTVVTIGLVFNIASGVMAAVGAIGLLVMLFISVFERQREIGIMRSLGAGSWAVAAQFLAEGLLIGLIAWVIGLPLGYGISHLLTEMLPLDEFDLVFPPVAAALGFAGMLVIATMASLWPSLSATRRTVSDILRYQ